MTWKDLVLASSFWASAMKVAREVDLAWAHHNLYVHLHPDRHAQEHKQVCDDAFKQVFPNPPTGALDPHLDPINSDSSLSTEQREAKWAILIRHWQQESVWCKLYKASRIVHKDQESRTAT